MSDNADSGETGSARPFLATALAALSFRASREELGSLDGRHILLGLVLTWAMGAGRNWGDPGVGPILSLGFGWVLHLLGFAVLMWLILKPLTPPSLSLSNLLALLALTMPLALIYAVPIEIIFDLGTVEDLDIRPFVLIAVWPVAVTLFYARRALSFDWGQAAVVVLLPFCLIVAMAAVIGVMPAFTVILAEAIMTLFGRPVDDAVMEEALTGFMMWHLVFYAALASFVSLLVAYGMLVYRYRKGLRAGGE